MKGVTKSNHLAKGSWAETYRLEEATTLENIREPLDASEQNKLPRISILAKFTRVTPAGSGRSGYNPPIHSHGYCVPRQGHLQSH